MPYIVLCFCFAFIFVRCACAGNYIYLLFMKNRRGTPPPSSHPPPPSSPPANAFVCRLLFHLLPFAHRPIISETRCPCVGAQVPVCMCVCVRGLTRISRITSWKQVTARRWKVIQITRNYHRNVSLFSSVFIIFSSFFTVVLGNYNK